MAKQPKKHFAKKSLGQNFLIDERVTEKIVTALDLKNDETVIEIGPGRGSLTEKLIERAGKVIAIEFDRDLIPELRDRFVGIDNFELVDADALHLNFAELTQSREKLKLAANLPYNISTAILQRLMEQREVFSELILMFQREVVERIVAPAGIKDRGFLTVLTELYFDVERLFDVSPEAFRPVPKIWSSVVKLTPINVKIIDELAFRDLISLAFAQKRKTLSNNLKAKVPNIGDALKKNDIAENRRAETLTIKEWISLYESLS